MAHESEPMGPEECLNFDPARPQDCSGPVEFRMPLSPSGRAFPRCDKHWDERLVQEERIVTSVGNWRSDVPPAWFDPAAAGERWDDEY